MINFVHGYKLNTNFTYNDKNLKIQKYFWVQLTNFYLYESVQCKPAVADTHVLDKLKIQMPSI